MKFVRVDTLFFFYLFLPYECIQGNKWSPLIEACRCGHHEIVRLLVGLNNVVEEVVALDNAKSVLKTNSYLYSFLLRKWFNVVLILILILFLYLCAKDGNSALMWCIENNRVDLLTLLLNNSSNVNVNISNKVS